MKYWVEIKGNFGENKARQLWQELEPKKANMTVAKSVHIYGEATEDCLKEILFSCAKTGADLQLNIG